MPNKDYSKMDTQYLIWCWVASESEEVLSELKRRYDKKEIVVSKEGTIARLMEEGSLEFMRGIGEQADS